MADVREEIRKMEAEGSAEKKGFMDIRYFIGLIFLIYGAILFVLGLVKPDYSVISGGLNLNLWWGLLMFFFGLAFYLFSKKPKEWTK